MSFTFWGYVLTKNSSPMASFFIKDRMGHILLRPLPVCNTCKLCKYTHNWMGQLYKAHSCHWHTNKQLLWCNAKLPILLVHVPLVLKPHDQMLPLLTIPGLATLIMLMIINFLHVYNGCSSSCNWSHNCSHDCSQDDHHEWCSSSSHGEQNFVLTSFQCQASIPPRLLKCCKAPSWQWACWKLPSPAFCLMTNHAQVGLTFP